MHNIIVWGMKDCYVSQKLNLYLTHEKAIREAREEQCFSKKDEKLWDLANSRGNTTYVITWCQQLQK